jgi:hypothetical protein
MSAQYAHVAHLSTSSFIPQPDLHPLYPTPSILSSQLSVSSTLTPGECTTLVNHSLIRACVFGDLPLLSFIIHDGKCNKWADLELKDEDGITPIGVCIMGFRPHDSDADLEREMEREECVRLLIKQGVELSTTDNCESPGRLSLSSRLFMLSCLSRLDSPPPCSTTCTGFTGISHALSWCIAPRPIPTQADTAGRDYCV